MIPTTPHPATVDPTARRTLLSLATEYRRTATPSSITSTPSAPTPVSDCVASPPVPATPPILASVLEVVSPRASELLTGPVVSRGGSTLLGLATRNPGVFMAAPAAPNGGAIPAYHGMPTKVWNLKSDKKVWSTTYWSYSAGGSVRAGDTDGDPELHLWAKGGCLDKLDQLLTKRGWAAGARGQELIPALNFLKNDGSPSGHYIPFSTIKEEDAQRTTGVDFDGDGVLKEGAKVDFLNDNSLFGQNGRTDGKLDVSWWGSCDQVALASLLFSNPKRDVTVEGITFTPQDIRGLLTVIASSMAPSQEFLGTRFSGVMDTLILKNGEVHQGTALNVSTEDCLRGVFERQNGNRILVKGFNKNVTKIRMNSGGNFKEFSVADVASLEREDRAEPSAADFHKTVKRWLRENHPFAMNKVSGEEVWNISVDEAKIRKIRRSATEAGPCSQVGFNGPRVEGEYSDYEATLKADGEVIRRYTYWIQKKDGVRINSGWDKNNPGFLWRPTTWDTSAQPFNERNVFVDPGLVKELHAQSVEPSLPQ